MHGEMSDGRERGIDRQIMIIAQSQMHTIVYSRQSTTDSGGIPKDDQGRIVSKSFYFAPTAHEFNNQVLESVRIHHIILGARQNNHRRFSVIGA